MKLEWLIPVFFLLLNATLAVAQQPVLSIKRTDPDTVEIHVSNCKPMILYYLQESRDLKSWINLTSFVAGDPATTLDYPEPSDDTTGFFRVASTFTYTTDGINLISHRIVLKLKRKNSQ